MDGNVTTITDPTGIKPPRSFTYDYSYWSHDGFKTRDDGVYVGENENYASQDKVFDDLGKGMLDNAWIGYNAALFAYGQTGSGKSYSMVGYGPNGGIVPMTCTEMFKRIKADSSAKCEFQVTFSMFEIYNEKVRDLLADRSRPGGLKVRQNQKKGFFVHGLRAVAVDTPEQVHDWMQQGNCARTVAATAMNESSSRSHMVISLNIKQVKNKGSSDSVTMTSDIHMVDLAGSERAETSGTQTDRLQEGSAINQSLSCLGNVISALAEQASGKQSRVPYRDSVLTKLLQNALGGNSRTVMISAISPSSMNYEETISTLRFADRAKQIKTKATVNENPTEKLIRELKEENAKLMEMLASPGGAAAAPGGAAFSAQDLIDRNNQQLGMIGMNWSDQVAKAGHASLGLDAAALSKGCYLENINEDPLLSGMIRHAIIAGKCLVARDNGKVPGKPPKGYDTQIMFKGLSILEQHAKMVRTGPTVTLEPLGNAQVLVNGKRLLKITTLQHHDRIVLAPNHLYKFVAAPEKRKKDVPENIDFDFLQTEIAAAQGLTSIAGVGTSLLLTSPDGAQVKQDLIRLLPMIAEANAIATELEKNVHFDLIVKNGASHNLTDKVKTVMVKVTDRNTNYTWMWPISKFINRKYLMQELYEIWVDGETIDRDQSKDPFWDPPEDVFLGSVYLYLQSLAYQMEVDETMSITNYQGQDEGRLHVGLSPCDATGRALDGADATFVSNSQDLLGTRMDLLVKIPYARSIKWVQEDPSRGISCRFKFYTDTKMRYTKTVLHEENPNFDYFKQFTIKSVSHNFVNYLEHNALVIEVWGKQGNGRPGGSVPRPLGAAGGASAADEASMDNVLSETQWRTERVQLLQQLEDLKEEVDFLKIERGHMQKEMTRITLESQSFMQSADGSLFPGDGPGEDLPGMVSNFLKEDHTLRERLDELSQYQYRPTKPELKSVKQACDSQQKEVARIEKELMSIVKAARVVTDAIGKKPAKK